jgi:hypothetical protein
VVGPVAERIKWHLKWTAAGMALAGCTAIIARRCLGCSQSVSRGAAFGMFVATTIGSFKRSFKVEAPPRPGYPPALAEVLDSDLGTRIKNSEIAIQWMIEPEQLSATAGTTGVLRFVDLSGRPIIWSQREVCLPASSQQEAKEIYRQRLAFDLTVLALRSDEDLIRTLLGDELLRQQHWTVGGYASAVWVENEIGHRITVEINEDEQGLSFLLAGQDSWGRWFKGTQQRRLVHRVGYSELRAEGYLLSAAVRELFVSGPRAKPVDPPDQGHSTAGENLRSNADEMSASCEELPEQDAATVQQNKETPTRRQLDFDEAVLESDSDADLIGVLLSWRELQSRHWTIGAAADWLWIEAPEGNRVFIEVSEDQQGIVFTLAVRDRRDYWVSGAWGKRLICHLSAGQLRNDRQLLTQTIQGLLAASEPEQAEPENSHQLEMQVRSATGRRVNLGALRPSDTQLNSSPMAHDWAMILSAIGYHQPKLDEFKITKKWRLLDSVEGYSQTRLPNLVEFKDDDCILFFTQEGGRETGWTKAECELAGYSAPKAYETRRRALSFDLHYLRTSSDGQLVQQLLAGYCDPSWRVIAEEDGVTVVNAEGHTVAVQVSDTRTMVGHQQGSEAKKSGSVDFRIQAHWEQVGIWISEKEIRTAENPGRLLVDAIGQRLRYRPTWDELFDAAVLTADVDRLMGCLLDPSLLSEKGWTLRYQKDAVLLHNEAGRRVKINIREDEKELSFVAEALDKRPHWPLLYRFSSSELRADRNLLPSAIQEIFVLTEDPTPADMIDSTFSQVSADAVGSYRLMAKQMITARRKLQLQQKKIRWGWLRDPDNLAAFEETTPVFQFEREGRRPAKWTKAELLLEGLAPEQAKNARSQRLEFDLAFLEAENAYELIVKLQGKELQRRGWTIALVGKAVSIAGATKRLVVVKVRESKEDVVFVLTARDQEEWVCGKRWRRLEYHLTAKQLRENGELLAETIQRLFEVLKPEQPENGVYY